MFETHIMLRVKDLKSDKENIAKKTYKKANRMMHAIIRNISYESIVNID